MALRQIIGKSVLRTDNTVTVIRRPVDPPVQGQIVNNIVIRTGVPVPRELSHLPYLEILECGHQIVPRRNREGFIVEPSIGRRCKHCAAGDPPHLLRLDPG
jgi:hypothetical protein